MRFPIKSLAIAVLLLTGAVSPASADVFQWRDPDTRLTLTFPDTWRRIHNQKPDDIITIAAPGDNAFATCRMRVREDKRFIIYPRRFAGELQRINYTREFWEGYVGEYAGAEINGVWDQAQLGDGFASYADVSFISAVGPKAQMRGIMFATVYNGTVYIAECSSEAEAYSSWYEPFLSVVKSVDFRDDYRVKPHQWYRNFLEDDVIRIRGKKDVDLYTY